MMGSLLELENSLSVCSSTAAEAFGEQPYGRVTGVSISVYSAQLEVCGPAEFGAASNSDSGNKIAVLLLGTGLVVACLAAELQCELNDNPPFEGYTIFLETETK